MLGVLIGLACAVALLNSFVGLWKNINAAKAAGLPVIVSPVNPMGPLWLLTERLVAPLLERLPFGLGSFLEYIRRGWNYYDKNRVHQRLGKAFALVSPSSLDVYLADAAASDEVFVRKKQFPKPTEKLKPIEIYGPTVASVDGSEWQRHRRITATPFNARNNRLVWTESLNQANQMLTFWRERGSAGVDSVAHDTMTLALNVITGAGFGKYYHFQDTSQAKPDKNDRPSYRACLQSVLENVVIIGAVPRWVYSIPWLPQSLHEYRKASVHLKQYMMEMASEVMQRLPGIQTEESNLLSTLVRENERARLEEVESKGSKRSHGLTDDELYGNFFIFSFAGHETTAHTLAYAFYHLAAFPPWQDWVIAEIDHVLRNQEQSSDTFDYETLFPQLKRCLALMHETLRLFPPVLGIPKCNGPGSVTLMNGEKPITIPARASVYPNVVGLQTHPDYWGADSLEWNPGRWIESSAHSDPASAFSLDESLTTPVRGSYLPWGDGPRVCPGRKFSQVEFVAVIATTLWKHRLEVVPTAGETAIDAQGRVKRVIDDSVVGFTLAMKEPYNVKIRLADR